MAPTARVAPPISLDGHRFGALAEVEQAILVLLALDGPLRITRLTDALSLAGIRETERRAHASTTVRPHVMRLVEAGLVHEDPNRGFLCTGKLRSTVLRWAAHRPDFSRFAASVPGAGYVGSAVPARMAIHLRRPEAAPELELLIAHDPRLAEDLVLETLEPFDPSWLSQFPQSFVDRLVDIAMTSNERRPSNALSLYGWFADDTVRVGALTPKAALAFGGFAVLRGDVDVLRALGQGNGPGALPAYARVALGVIEGRASDVLDEAEALPDPKRDDHAGVLFVLALVTLRTRTPVSDRISKWIAHGAKKGATLRQTFKVLEYLVQTDMGTAGMGVSWARDVPIDVMTNLCRMMLPADPLMDGLVLAGLADAGELVERYRKLGYVWIAEQYAEGAHRCYQLLSETYRQHLRGAAPQPATLTVGPSLLDAKTTREPWEIVLDRIDAVAKKIAPGGNDASPTASAERIVWRTHGTARDLEPYVQKRGPDGRWSVGRKLAIKHLLGKSPLLSKLPPEDARVAAYAFEDRVTSFGYPSVHHRILERAWLELVGHPRVHVRDEAAPREVVRGTPRLQLRADGDDRVVEMTPPRLGIGVNVVEQDQRLVVYLIEDELASLHELVSPSFRVPARGKPQLMAMLERLAPLVSVESTERTSASEVAPDSRPHARLVPSRGGLTMTLLVRPLGPGTALVDPGEGAPTLLGQVDGKTVQTERDLAGEEARADEVIARCPVLEGRETGPFSFHVTEPEACLDLVAALRDLGDAIVVEWPQGSPVRLRARVGRPALRGRLSRGSRTFFLEGALHVDGELSIELEQVLELLAQHPGRFVRLASGEYVELERELREVLEGIAAARVDGAGEAGRVALPHAALAVVDPLTQEGGAIALDARAAGWRTKLDEVFARPVKIPRGFEGELRDYQREGFAWLVRLSELELGACLADDMGLGKTVQIAALLLHRAADGPALVVAPTSVCEGWRREIERFAPTLRVRAHWESDRDATLAKLSKRDVVVTSYTLLQQKAEALHAIDWNTAVLDEAQLIKNAETLRAKAAFGLRARARIVATGTPVENHAGDIHSLFQFLDPGLLGSYKRFSANLAGPGARQQKRILLPLVLRRTKAQVLDDLPPITEIQRNVILTPGEAKLYESVRKAALEKLEQKGMGGKARMQVFAELSRLRRLCCPPALVAPNAGLTSSKLESFIELVEELVAGRHRMLVFSQFTDVLALVRPLLDAKGVRYQYLDGATPAKQRAAAVDAFQAGEGDAFLISLKAGGFGLNLTAADYVIHLDPWWNPAVEAQASDRAHRIGQTRPVTVYRLVTAGTIESRIVELHREKRDLADAVLEGTEGAAHLSATEIRALLGGTA